MIRPAGRRCRSAWCFLRHRFLRRSGPSWLTGPMSPRNTTCRWTGRQAPGCCRRVADLPWRSTPRQQQSSRASADPSIFRIFSQCRCALLLWLSAVHEKGGGIPSPPRGLKVSPGSKTPAGRRPPSPISGVHRGCFALFPKKTRRFGPPGAPLSCDGSGLALPPKYLCLRFTGRNLPGTHESQISNSSHCKETLSSFKFFTHARVVPGEWAPWESFFDNFWTDDGAASGGPFAAPSPTNVNQPSFSPLIPRAFSC